MPFILILILIVGFGAYFITTYNKFQQFKTQIEASIQEIGNQLKRQASLIPNLESAAKGQLTHEKEVYKMLTDARQKIAKAEKSGSATDIENAIQSVQNMVPSINIAVESNPELKADRTITKFMDELTDTADKLMYSRRSVIDLSQAYNQMLITFPSNMLANMFGFTKEKGLEVPLTGSHVSVSKEEMNDVKVSI